MSLLVEVVMVGGWSGGSIRHWLSLLQHGFFVVCISVPAQMAVVKILTSRGITLMWFQRAGILIVCLLAGAVSMVCTGLLLSMIARLVLTFRNWLRAGNS